MTINIMHLLHSCQWVILLNHRQFHNRLQLFYTIRDRDIKNIIPKLLRHPGSPPVFDTAVSFRALDVWTIDSSRAVNPDFRPSPWLLSFEYRKNMTPQSYALTHRFQGSTADNYTQI